MVHSTKQRLLDTGMVMLLERGYHDLGIQALLKATGVPKGSFYHHFESKQDFALAVVDQYMDEVHRALKSCLRDSSRPPLERVRRFFECTREKYRREGYLGCLLGSLGQELAATSEIFRKRIDECLAFVSSSIAACLEEASDELPAGIEAQQLADIILDSWEGAALRTRLSRDSAPLDAVMSYYFGAPAATPC